MVSNQSTKSVRFVTENIMFRKVRQDDFEKFMTVKHKKSYNFAQIEVYLTFFIEEMSILCCCICNSLTISTAALLFCSTSWGIVLCTGRSIPQYGFHRAQSNLGKIQRGRGIHGGIPPSIFLCIEYHINKKRTDGRFCLRIERLPQLI